MFRGILLLLFVAACSPFPAQSGHDSIPAVLIAPYEEVMFVSDITNALAQGSGCTPGEVNDRCRQGMVYMLMDQGSKHFQCANLLEPDHHQELEKVYFSLARTYQTIPRLTYSPASDSAYQSLMTRQELANNRFLDRVEKHLGATITDASLFDELNQRHDFDFLVLLNQLDFIQTEDPLTKLPGGGERWCRVHYTITDTSGTVVVSGVARASFPKEINSLDVVVASVFPKCADQIWRSLWLTLQ
ncbi:MAG: hypothetical protein JNM00_10135 [Flavobacteriales bacterium]|nr:hypothetical protein [Flavobacteriales bacterium]